MQTSHFKTFLDLVPVSWLVLGKIMLHKDFQITGSTKLDFFFVGVGGGGWGAGEVANTEYYPSLKYHTKEFAIHLWLSPLQCL